MYSALINDSALQSFACEDKTIRNSQMADEYRAGSTLQEIGDKYGITRERVRQVLKRYGMSRSDGGVSVRATSNYISKYKDRVNNRAARIARHEAFYGCDFSTLCEINGRSYVATSNSAPTTPALAYRNQKYAAKRRGIEFRLTLPEWWRIWQESGHWEQRGRGDGYCMTRIGDTGPYEVGNVEIKTIGEKFSESYYKHPWKERFPKGGFGGKNKGDACKRNHPGIESKYSPSGNCSVCARGRYMKRVEMKKAS